MKEIIVKISDENSELATRMLEELGAEIEVKNTVLNKRNGTKKLTVKKKKTTKRISPTYLFGKWKNLEIDAKKIREEAWDRSHRFL